MVCFDFSRCINTIEKKGNLFVWVYYIQNDFIVMLKGFLYQLQLCYYSHSFCWYFGSLLIISIHLLADLTNQTFPLFVLSFLFNPTIDTLKVDLLIAWSQNYKGRNYNESQVFVEKLNPNVWNALNHWLRIH
jgi:hypothetical protein